MSSSEQSGGAAPPARRDSNRKAVALALAAAVGGFLFGFDSSVINGAVSAIQGQYELSSFVIGFVVAVALLGSAVGAWFAGPLADRIGRTRVMLVSAVLFLASAVGSGFAFTPWDLTFWRVVGGVAIGIASVIAPAYIAEISPSKIRGRLASFQQLAITLGIFAALLSDAFFAGAADGGASGTFAGLDTWRWMLLAEAVPAVVFGILALLIPESPRYLVAKGQTQRAVAVFRDSLHARNADALVQAVRKSLQREDEPSMRDLRGPRLGLQPIVWTGIILSVLQQFVGINVIFYYSTTLWQSVGFDESDSFTISVFTAVLNVLVTFVAVAFVDKVGRRKLLMAGSAGMVLGLGAVTLAFTQAAVVPGQDDVSLPTGWGPVALVGANLFVIAFGASWGPVVWVLLGEMFPNRIRAAALAVAASAQWIANFIVTVTFPVLSQDVSLWATYLIYTVFAALSFLFVKTKVVETNGVELEDMGTDKQSAPARAGT
ncbi:sugar porter family MFS transporter [Pseudokineococcus marinus]|uniref:Sugar porter family MFS transporter n=1 Tax=Pseudokineococcus marinus TaxID=351215 RepID=A0A849BR98_9ACTN|nr:sugar porter family MFS transporter [Pseudokineococcus marinus]NNH23352.1 sugar porter family MFS transporter [Pseudokineococcus marinus]